MVRQRLVLLTFLIALPFGAVVARLANLQLDERQQELLSRRAEHVRVDFTTPMRGRILTRTGTVLADNEPVYFVNFVKRDLNPAALLLDALEEIVGESHGAFSDGRLRGHFEEVSAHWVESESREGSDADWKPLIRSVSGNLVVAVRKRLRNLGVHRKSEARLVSFRQTESQSDTYNLWINPRQANNAEIVIRRFAERLAALAPTRWPSVEAIRSELFERFRKKEKTSAPDEVLRLLDDVPLDVVTAIEYYPEQFRGLTTGVRQRRAYPQRDLFGSLVGFVRSHTPGQQSALEDSERLLERSKWKSMTSLDEFREQRGTLWGLNERRGDRALELFYNDELRGRYGGRSFRVDARRRPVALTEELVVKHGADLVTTVDADLQRFLHQRLTDEVRAGVGEAASGVVRDVTSGAVLAAVGVPALDPNQLSSARYRKQLKKGQLLDRPTRHIHFPGSIFKIVVAAAALESAAEIGYSPSDTYDCNTTYKPWPKMRCTAPHGQIDLATALKRSCNIYFYQLGWKVLGAGRMRDWALRFGYGRPAGIDLPYQQPGILDSLDKIVGRRACHLAIGQVYVKATPLQVARSVALIARTGKGLPLPHLVRPNPKAIEEPTSVLRNPETIAAIHDGLWRAAHEPGGTAANYGLEKYRVAVKTGTAQIGKRGDKLYVAWIAGYAPAAADGIDTVKPRIAFAIAVDRTSKYGGTVCAPILADLLKHLSANDPSYKLQPSYGRSEQERRAPRDERRHDE